MIKFEVSAPSRLSLFGEHGVTHGKNGLTAAMDIRTTLTFYELPFSSNSCLQLHIPQINLHSTPLQDFLMVYNNCVEDMMLLREKVLEFTRKTIIGCTHNPSHWSTFIDIFYYLLIYIVYKEQIDIKPFNIYLSMNIMMDEKLVCPASFAVCLAASLLHWSRLQKGVRFLDTFDDTDLEKIQLYAASCEKISSESGIVDVIACTYGSIIKYQLGETICQTSLFGTPSMMILLVDSKQTQNFESQTQRMTDLMNMYPEITNSILNDIDTVTKIAYKAFQKLAEVYKDKELDIETKRECILQQYEALESSICKNQKLLESLDMSHSRLDKICAIAQIHKCYGKYTDIGNGRYAYIWCPYWCEPHRTNQTKVSIMLLTNELKSHGFDVTETNLVCSGVRIEE